MKTDWQALESLGMSGASVVAIKLFADCPIVCQRGDLLLVLAQARQARPRELYPGALTVPHSRRPKAWSP